MLNQLNQLVGDYLRMATPKPPSMNRQQQNVQHVREVPSYPESYDPANPYAKDDLNTPNEPKVTGAIEAMKWKLPMSTLSTPRC